MNEKSGGLSLIRLEKLRGQREIALFDLRYFQLNNEWLFSLC